MNAVDPLEVLELAKKAIHALAESQASNQVKAAALDTASNAIRAAETAQNVAMQVAALLKKASS